MALADRLAASSSCQKREGEARGAVTESTFMVASWNADRAGNIQLLLTSRGCGDGDPVQPSSMVAQTGSLH